MAARPTSSHAHPQGPKSGQPTARGPDQGLEGTAPREAVNSSLNKPWRIETPRKRVWHERYHVLSRLGAGTFGTALLVEDTQDNNEQKVMKQIFAGTMEDENTVKALAEAKLLKDMHHSNIVSFCDAFMEDDFVCIVTEYCEGGDLAGRIERQREQEKKPFALDTILDWFVQLTMALQHIHERKVLHRDLKTNNIFLRNHVIKLGDFGIARVLANTFDEATTFAGTPYYMSPEALQCAGYNSKSDIWALGCVLFELCCLRHAFDGNSLMGLLWKICQGNPPTLPDSCAPILGTLVSQLLQKEPGDRPSATDILRVPEIHAHLARMRAKSQARRTSVTHDPTTPRASASGPSGPAAEPLMASHSSTSSGGPLAMPAADASRALTPRERMLEKRKADADQRAKEVSQAAVSQKMENVKRQAERHNRNLFTSSSDAPLRSSPAGPAGSTAAATPRPTTSAGATTSPPPASGAQPSGPAAAAAAGPAMAVHQRVVTNTPVTHTITATSSGLDAASATMANLTLKGPGASHVGAPMFVNTSLSCAARLAEGEIAEEIPTMLDSSLTSSTISKLLDSTSSFIPESADDAERYYQDDFDDSAGEDDEDEQDQAELQRCFEAALNSTVGPPKPPSPVVMDTIALPTRAAKRVGLEQAAIKCLGDAKYKKIYDLYYKARQEKKSEPEIARQVALLAATPEENTACFVVDQVVYMDLYQ
eukprot:m.89750 g.89750  ORF g.89750 m.89750 type:complete len:709 (-) comp13672_c0_seq2:22-2148(-)